MYFGVRGEFQNKDSISFQRKRVHEAATTSFTSLPHIYRKLTVKEFTISAQTRGAWLTSSLPELSAVGRDNWTCWMCWRVRLAFNLNSTPPPSSLREGWVSVDFNMTRGISQFTTVCPSSKSRLFWRYEIGEEEEGHEETETDFLTSSVWKK